MWPNTYDSNNNNSLRIYSIPADVHEQLLRTHAHTHTNVHTHTQSQWHMTGHHWQLAVHSKYYNLGDNIAHFFSLLLILCGIPRWKRTKAMPDGILRWQTSLWLDWKNKGIEHKVFAIDWLQPKCTSETKETQHSTKNASTRTNRMR